ncbi:uncharacterized protein LOC141779223 [Sebastes fasciatus]|uniref:uncharacterized protein LOC141779223 n=1 Tax=Sebastes fasciatus TaxID=394691 RepID=UPI003D9F755E
MRTEKRWRPKIKRSRREYFVTALGYISQKMAHLYPQGLLLLLVLLIVRSECRDMVETVLASEEEDVVLPCFDSYDPKSCDRVRLIKYATNTSQMKVIFARPERPKFQDAERVKWQADGNGQMSLFMTKSQKSDEGLHGCEIWQGWDCILVKNISLKVKDCKTLQAVKAAPNTPVNLTCPVEMTSGQQGPQNISWAMLLGGDPVSVNSKRAEMKGTSLAIQSVIYTDSGWYRCKYMLGQTQRCFDMNLLVQEENVAVATTVPGRQQKLSTPGLTTSEIIWEPKKEGSSGKYIAVAVALASVIIGIAIVAALIGLFIYRRRNTQRVTQQTQRHTEGNQDAYEIVNLTLDRTNRLSTANSLYQQIPDNSLYTFRY